MWSVPADLKSRDPAKYDAVMKLNKFMWDNSINWSRTGHMSYRASVIASDAYKNLPHRDEYAATADIMADTPHAEKYGAIQDLVGNNLKKEYSFEKLINEAKTYNVALSGWGLRNWELVSKHKKKIIKNLKDGFSEYLNFKSSIKNKYLLVHIRRTDFLAVEEFKELNFSDQTWLKGILKLCEIKSLNTVVIFSDANVSNLIFSNLKKRGLKTIIPEKNNLNENFLKLFFSYVDNASSVICNASTLVLSLSFLSHEKIFLPSRKSDFQEINLNNAHSLYPACLNWK